jgi:hypothetical protein
LDIKQTTGGGFFCEHDGLIHELEGIEHEIKRGVRGTLGVLKGKEIIYRTRLSLTAAGARKGFLSACEARGVTVDERVLLALDEAVRRDRSRANNAKNKTGEPPSNFSYKVPPAVDFSAVRRAFTRHLVVLDVGGTLVLPLAAVAAHGLVDEELVWLLVVGPPSSLKTELLRALTGLPFVYPLSDLSSKTFASGLEIPGGGDPSLLNRLNNELLVMKDLTTVLEKQNDELKSILAQLREIYDGAFDRTWGTGRELHWTGRLGFIAGVTGIIDRHHNAMATLGERFLLDRPRQPDRRSVARHVLDRRNTATMRTELRDVVQGFLMARREPTPPLVDDATRESLAEVADFVTRARSGVYRDGYTRKFLYAPDPEAPARLALVLRALARGIAVVLDEESVTDEHLALVLRAGLDTLPVMRRRVLAQLMRPDQLGANDSPTAEIAERVQAATETVRLVLEDLQGVGVVHRTRGGQGKADLWRLEDAFVDPFRHLVEASADQTFYEKWEGGPPKNFWAASVNGTARSNGEAREEVAQAWAGVEDV